MGSENGNLPTIRDVIDMLAGDEAATKFVCCNLRAFIYQYCRGKGVAEHLAGDAAQDVLTSLLKTLSEDHHWFETYNHFVAFVCKSACNKLTDYRRKQKRAKETDLDRDVVDPETLRTPEDVALEEQRRLVFAALCIMDGKKKTRKMSLLLRERYGFLNGDNEGDLTSDGTVSVKALAKRRNTKAGVIRKALSRAIKKLGEIINRLQIEEG